MYEYTAIMTAQIHALKAAGCRDMRKVSKVTNVFIDGSAGTTGLRIRERLSERQDIVLITLPEAWRKDPDKRKQAINEADVVFLCLPDAAAIEAAGMTENPDTIVIDTSTAHRVNDEWVYGFAEIGDLRSRIRTAKRIANPGCHASGFIALVAPLILSGLVSRSTCLSAYSLTGYSGGGKKMINQYEDKERCRFLDAPRLYGLGQTHKHLPEMKKMCCLETEPIFCPVVAPYYAGMEVTVPLFGRDIKGTTGDIESLYEQYYQNGLVHFVRQDSEEGFCAANAMEGYDDMTVTVQGNNDRILLIARFDNLGKGASGAAIQNMNIALDIDEMTGLRLYGGKANE